MGIGRCDDEGEVMDIVDRLKASHSLLGDPLHREAWEEIERLREQNFYLDIKWTETSNALQMAVNAHGTGKAPGAAGAGSWFDHAIKALEYK